MLIAVAALHVALVSVLARLLVVDAAPPARTAPLVMELIALAPPASSPDSLPTPATPRSVAPIVSPPLIVPVPQPLPQVATASAPQQSLATNASQRSPAPAAAPAFTAAPASALPAPIVPPDAFAAGLDNPAPRYPLESRRLHEQGTVVLSVEVTSQGRVASVNIARSSGHIRLDQAALNILRSWRFQPATQAGKAVSAHGIVEIPFVLTRR